jgi:hypothetical protein
MRTLRRWDSSEGCLTSGVPEAISPNEPLLVRALCSLARMGRKISLLGYILWDRVMRKSRPMDGGKDDQAAFGHQMQRLWLL